ncbi:MAG: response regulator, partial [Desulfobacterales bacterium]|nr:response regulator [Desulfobacterales bacterium]
KFGITDTGIGIPKDRISRLFKSFSQVDASTTRKYGGTGLGLAISKKLSEMMGGQIGVYSDEGKGSTFWFTAVFAKQSKDKELVKVLPADIKGKRILAVDDNPINIEIICAYVKSFGCRVQHSYSGKEALNLLREAIKTNDPYEMAILDYMMPSMDGEGLGRIIKDDPELKNTKLVMLSSRGLRGDASRMKEIGFAAYLTKPIKRNQLFDCLITVFGDIKVQETKKQKELFVTRFSLTEVKKQMIKILLAEDNVVNQKLALKYLDKFGYHADVVGNGKEAVKALEVTNYNLILMDVQMPEMDGFEATQFIRSNESTVINKNVYIIAMTAHAMKGDRERCIAVGMNDYVSKPIKPQELLDAIEKCISIIYPSLEKNETNIVNSLKILVVDDEPDNHKLANFHLKKLGFETDNVKNGKEALQALEKNKYAAILMDVQMPEMDGLEATKLIRDMNSKVIDHKIPIIAMTARTLKGDKESCLDAGMNDYLSKPLEAKKLIQILQKYTNVF